MHIAGKDYKEQADLSITIEFQGKLLSRQRCMVYWFRWGEWSFDIRCLREFYNKKPERSIDFHRGNPCTVFQKQMKEVMDLIGDEPFEDVMRKIVLNEEEQERVEKERRSLMIYEDNDDDLPF